MKWKSRKLWVTIAAAVAGALYPPVLPLVAKLAAVYVPVQGAIDLAEKVGAAVSATRAAIIEAKAAAS